MNRRQFVSSLSASLLVGSAVRGADQAARLFPFGFSLYGAPGIAPSVALPMIAQLGYDCVELSCLPGSSTEPKTLTAAARTELRRQLADSGLAVASLMENLKEPADEATHRANLERLQAAFDLGASLASAKPPVVETILGHKPAEWNDIKQRLADRLHDWARLAEKNAAIIAIKPHVANALHLPADALWLIEQLKSPRIRLAYDYSHYSLRGLGLAETIAAIVPHAAFVHVKDARGMPEKFEFMLPGEGNTDFRELFRLLQAGSYRGSIVVEVSSQISRREGYDWLAAARRSYESLSPALSR